MNLSDPVSKLYLVGPTYAKRLERLAIKTIEDLIFHFPFRYDDFSLISPISLIQPGETITIRGKVQEIKNEFTKNAKRIQKAIVSDNSGRAEIIWFNQPFLVRTIKVGESYNFSGKVDWFGHQKVFISPEYEKIKEQYATRNTQYENITIHTGRLVPIYPETYGISSKWLRSRIKTALELCGPQIQEFLPQEIILQEGLIPEKEAIFRIHFPDNQSLAEKAHYRLAFDELFLIQLSALIRKSEWETKKIGKSFFINREKINNFIQKLPFTLTNAQKKSLSEILTDMQKSQPMNRLLQGDVGCGKTIVVAIAAYVTFFNDYQTLFMAPTEILARQHYNTLKTFLTPFGVPIELITGNKATKQPAKSAGNQATVPKIVVGTHALLYQEFDQKKIGLVVIDEQHRFGVEQRALLATKGHCPHFLTLTATPIPRTIALTLYGDLDLSLIDEMPTGRLEVKTWVVPKEKREKAYQWIRQKVKDTNEQAFIICPLIEESETLTTVRAATKEFEILAKIIFPDLKLGLLHGKIKAKEKEEILSQFREGKLDILVATPVVEVGIDIPNATIMLIEAAERFGLAQLHQLRGRVGRRNLPSYCLLFTENETPLVINRLKSLEKTHLGIELAEIDLKLRGPGEIYGTKQHGFPDLRVASFSDISLIQKTRAATIQLLSSHFPLLTLTNSPLNLRLQKYKIKTVGPN